MGASLLELSAWIADKAVSIMKGLGLFVGWSDTQIKCLFWVLVAAILVFLVWSYIKVQEDEANKKKQS